MSSCRFRLNSYGAAHELFMSCPSSGCVQRRSHTVVESCFFLTSLKILSVYICRDIFLSKNQRFGCVSATLTVNDFSFLMVKRQKVILLNHIETFLRFFFFLHGSRFTLCQDAGDENSPQGGDVGEVRLPSAGVKVALERLRVHCAPIV